MTKITFDIETYNASTFMDSVLWVKRRVLEKKVAKVMYELGLYDALETIERYGYDWKSEFIYDDVMQRFGRAIQYSASTVIQMKVGKTEPLTIKHIKDTKSMLLMDKKCYDAITSSVKGQL